MEINRSNSINGTITIDNKVVAGLSANISNNGLNFSVSVNILNEDVINASPENLAKYRLDYDQFMADVKTYSTYA